MNSINEENKNEPLKDETLKDETLKPEHKNKRNEYMRIYMKEYNKKRGLGKKEKRPPLTPEEKKQRLKANQKKYYNNNKMIVINRQAKYRNKLKIANLTNKLNLLKTLELN